MKDMVGTLRVRSSHQLLKPLGRAREHIVQVASVEAHAFWLA